MKIAMVAGELSGDLLGAALIKALRKTHPDLEVVGVGGPAMQAEGCHSLYPLQALSLMGFFEPLRHLPELLKIRSGLYHYFIQNPPDVFIGIDSPDFNLGLELKLKAHRIPIVHYVSPSVWAWRKKRIYKIAKAVDLMLTLLPFEAEFYREHHVSVEFVGHPLADQLPLTRDQKAARQKLNLSLEKTYIALLPGSRNNEIKYLGDVFIQAAKECWEREPSLEFITAAANKHCREVFQKKCQSLAPHVPIHFYDQCSQDVMAAANLILVTSGTATLEALLHKRPMVIAYKTGAITFQIARRLIRVPFIGLPNLLAQEKIVPEFIQHDATPKALAQALLNFLNDTEKVAHLEKKFTEMHHQLRQNASEKAAKAILHLISKSFRGS